MTGIEIDVDHPPKSACVDDSCDGSVTPSDMNARTGASVEWMSERQMLVESINTTAQMVRPTLMLFMLLALYVLLTPVASTDANILANGQVILPLLGVGLSVEFSCVIGPLVLSYLHVMRVNTVDPESRDRNHGARCADRNTADILFDRILVSPRMLMGQV